MTETNATDLEQTIEERLNVEPDPEYVETAAELAVDLWGDLDHSVAEAEPEDLAENFYRYLEYDVEPDSARGTILRDLASAQNEDVGTLLESDGRGVTDVAVEDITEPDQFVNVEVEVADIWDNDTEVLSQVGLAFDDTGYIKFQSWSKSGKPLLTEGQTYRLERVATDEYQGRMSISLNSDTTVEMIDREIEEPDTSVQFEGFAVDTNPGSGLIKRCSKENCNRVLQDGSCTEHGSVSGEFDLRLKLVLDNGTDTQRVVLNREQTESVTGIRQDEAEQMAKDALDRAVVLDKMEDEVLMRYFEVEGWMGDSELIIVEDVQQEQSDTDVSELVDRLSALRTENFSQENLTEVNQ